MSIFATKSIEQIKTEQIGHGEATLTRVLGPWQLIMLGVGAIIGTGIFVLTGQAAAANAGPAIVISMVVAGLAGRLAGLCFFGVPPPPPPPRPPPPPAPPAP